jgi:hypothetical protein
MELSGRGVVLLPSRDDKVGSSHTYPLPFEKDTLDGREVGSQCFMTPLRNTQIRLRYGTIAVGYAADHLHVA